jgi:hypothetical protein
VAEGAVRSLESSDATDTGGAPDTRISRPEAIVDPVK